MNEADKQKLEREIADLKGQVRLTAGLRPNLLENHKRALEIKKLRRDTGWRSNPWLQPGTVAGALALVIAAMTGWAGLGKLEVLEKSITVKQAESALQAAQRSFVESAQASDQASFDQIIKCTKEFPNFGPEYNECINDRGLVGPPAP